MTNRLGSVLIASLGLLLRRQVKHQGTKVNLSNWVRWFASVLLVGVRLLSLSYDVSEYTVKTWFP